MSCGTSEEAACNATSEASENQRSRISNGPSYELSALIMKGGAVAQLQGTMISVFLQPYHPMKDTLIGLGEL